MTKTKLTLAALSYAVAGLREAYGENFEAAMAEFSFLSPDERAEAARLLFQAGLMVQSLNMPASPEQDEAALHALMLAGE